MKTILVKEDYAIMIGDEEEYPKDMIYATFEEKKRLVVFDLLLSLDDVLFNMSNQTTVEDL